MSAVVPSEYSPLRRVVGALAIGAVAVTLPCSAFATDGYFENGYGVKAKGMGGAAIAYPQEALGMAANPAAATALGNSFEIDADYFRPIRSATIHGNLAAPDADYNGNGLRRFVIPELGVTYQLSPRWAVGLAIYGNGGLDTKYGTNPYGRFGATGTAGVNLEQALISPTVAYRFAEHQSIGLSLNIAYEQFSAYGLGLFKGFSVDPNAVSDRSTDSTTGIGVRLGYQGQVTPWLTVGAVWQSQTVVDSFNRYKGLFSNGGNFNIPSSYGFGAALTALPGIDFALDVTRINYSEIESVGDPIDSLFLGKPLGSSKGPGFGWRDVTAVKFGVNWHATDRLQLRIGYNHSDNPIPANQTFINILAPGTIEHQFTLGGTWAVSPKWEVSLDGLYAPSNTLRGASNAIPAAFGGGTADIRLSELALGGGVAYHF